MKNLKDIIKAIAENQTLIGFVKVGKVIGIKDNVAEVEPIDSPAVVSVRLKVETSNDDGFTIIPVAGSLILFLLINEHDGILLHADKIEGYRIRSENEDLKVIITDILAAIEQLTVTTPAGPSGVPINMAAFTTVKNRLNQLLK